MPHFDHPILDEVAALQVPCPEDIVINHGAALVIRGVRAEHDDGDIDATISLDNSDHLLRLPGWTTSLKEVGKRADGSTITVSVVHDAERRFDFHAWDFSVPRYEATGKGRVSLEEQKTRAEQDERTGIWVATLEYVRETKQSTGRPQDRADIELIDGRA